MAAADRASIASLTCQRVQALIVGKSGKNWMDLLKAIRDNDLDGRQLAPHMDNPASLQEFLKTDWDCNISTGIAKLLHGLICAAAGGRKQVRCTTPPPWRSWRRARRRRRKNGSQKGYQRSLVAWF